MSDSSAHPTHLELRLGGFEPKIVDLTQAVLFGDVWERDGLSHRDRSLVTIAALVALHRPEQLDFHLRRGLANGLTLDQLIESITHLFFCAGWPSGMTAIGLLQVIASEQDQQPSRP